MTAVGATVTGLSVTVATTEVLVLSLLGGDMNEDRLRTPVVMTWLGRTIAPLNGRSKSVHHLKAFHQAVIAARNR